MYFDHSTVFYERFLNTVAYIVVYFVMAPNGPLLGISDSLLDRYVPEKPNIGMDGLYRNSEMTLVLMDPYCSDQHRVSAPHFQFIGGLGAHDPDPLPKDLKKFMDSAKDGVIVFTLGSGLKRLPKAMLDKVIPVFQELKLKVIMRHDGEMPKLIPKNVLIQKWLPQNDLLGHPNTKLFITHAGNNGQLEGIYHGIPMLQLPHVGDQYYNAHRAVRKNYGLTLDPHEFTSQEFNDTIHELLNNPLYSSSIKKCSSILHSLDSAKVKAAFWVEHLLKFGGSHLKPYYIDMPLWKYFMFDVLAAFLVIDILVVFVFYRCVRCCCCRKKVPKPGKKKNKKE